MRRNRSTPTKSAAKNTLLDGRLQANLTAWYYDYGNYQISSIIANTSVNTNINSFLNGLEGEFLWAPTDRWQFDLNASWTQSKVGNTDQIDTRNPGGGLPYAVVVKDAHADGDQRAELRALSQWRRFVGQSG